MKEGSIRMKKTGGNDPTGTTEGKPSRTKLKKQNKYPKRKGVTEKGGQPGCR